MSPRRSSAILDDRSREHIERTLFRVCSEAGLAAHGMRDTAPIHQSLYETTTEGNKHMKFRNIAVISVAATIGAVALGIGGAQAAGLLGSEGIKDNSIR